MMIKVTNTGTAPRGVYSGGVVKFIRPGESREMVLTGVELYEVRSTEGLTIDEPEATKPEAKKADKPNKTAQ